MKKIILIVVLILLLIAGFFGYKLYKNNYSSNVSKAGYILIPRNAGFQQILDSIAPYIKNKEAFKKVALDKNLDKYIKEGRYQIEEGMNNTAIVNMIKAGNQMPNQFRIGDFGDVYQMIGKVTKKTEIDSLKFVDGFNKIAQKKGLSTAEELKPYFFTDTYDFFWTVTPEEFFKKFEKQYNDFWTKDNIAKQEKLGLSRNQVYAMASIVQKESGSKPDEQRKIAGLYLNRYHKGMKLQSDPTVIYAINKQNNFNKIIKRVYYKDLKTPSPYNTYMNTGIPPGPICMVSKMSVESVLDADTNNYIYMCADPKRPGYHRFTADPAEHAKNAKEYQAWLNSRNIK